MTEDLLFCPYCDAFRARRIEHRREVQHVRGDAIAVDADIAVCTVCGHDIGDLELDDATQERAFTLYRQKHGILSPQQIREVRERTGLSQLGFTRLLEWGERTVHRYETGALPDGAHNSLLRALQDDETLFRFVESREHVLTPLDRRKVHEAMDGRKPAIRRATIRRTVVEIINEHPVSDHGNKVFDVDRIGHMIVYFVSRCKVTTTKLNKLLWYADFLSYKRRSVSLSGMVYLRYQYGPVPQKFSLLFGELENEGFMSSEPFTQETSTGVYEGTRYDVLIPFDSTIFLRDELDVLETVVARFGPLTANEVTAYSHREDAWIETPMLAVIPYAKSVTLSLD